MKTELEGRTKEFGIRIVRFIRTFPKSVDGIEVGRQLLKAGTSIGANYREANRAESRADFIHKVGIAEKEAAETAYRLEICEQAPLGDLKEVKPLLKEANELLPIFVTIGRKAKNRPRALPDPSIVAAVITMFLFSLSRFPLFAFHSLL